MRTALTGYSTAVVFLFMARTTLAQAPGPIMVDIAPCLAVADSAERYACYDRLAASARTAENAAQQVAPAPAQPPTVPQAAVTPIAEPSPVATESPAVAEASSTPVAEFGKTSPQGTRAAQVIANEGGDEELHDVITDLRQREPNRWLITLESGQVWYQSNSERFRLVKGMAVRIYPSPLRGSYRLARDDGKETGFIQVERVD
jgi:hypothetical protein